MAMESGWNKDANYAEDDPEIIEHINSGSNYGILPTGDLVVIDCDTEKLYKSLPDKWKESLTVITGRDGERGHHIFLDCENSPPDKIVINDTETRAPLGDIRGSESPFYTVGAGSIHPDTGRKYQYVDQDAELVTVSWEEIQRELIEKFAIKIKQEIPSSTRGSTNSLSEQLNLRIENFAMPGSPVVKRANGDIQGKHPIHGSSTGMNFAINPAKNVWHCFRDDTGGDPVAWIAYAHCGVPETDCNRLTPQQFQDVKKWLRENGYANEIKALDDKHFQEDPNIPKPDISGILYPEAPSIDDVEETDRLISEARKKCKLPPFPEISNGLFKDYVEFGKRVSYSLHEFHYAALLAAVSMALGRKVRIQVGMTKVYPNVFVMVVGHTTISGKSVACNNVVDSFGPAIVYEEPIAKFNSTNILRGTISEPALIQGLNDTYNSLWYYDDCAGFFSDATTWNSHILGTMCSLYDGSEISRTLSKRGKGEEKFKWECPSPFVSLLFNTTNKDVEDVANAKLFSSGFFPRLMWFYGEGGYPRKNEDVSKEDIEELGRIYKQISYLRNTIGELSNDSIIFGVCEEIEDWKLQATLGRLEKEDEAFRTAVARGFIHCYKIAVILTMVDKKFQNMVLGLDQNEYPVKIKIPHEHAMEAIKIVETYLIPRMVFVQGLCEHNDMNNHQITVKKALKQLGGSADKTKILRKTHLSSKDLASALRTLVDSEEITIKERSNLNTRPTTIVILND